MIEPVIGVGFSNIKIIYSHVLSRFFVFTVKLCFTNAVPERSVRLTYMRGTVVQSPARYILFAVYRDYHARCRQMGGCYYT